MKRSEAILSEQGRIAVLAAVRAALRAKLGDRLILGRDEAGKVHVRVKADLNADQARQNEDLARLPAFLEGARSRMTDVKRGDSIGDVLLVEDERTKSSP